MTDPRDLDPAPFEELPSDVKFGEWLEGLDVDAVLKDYEATLAPAERLSLRYLRRRAKGHP
jgi:hypothetical protein